MAKDLMGKRSGKAAGLQRPDGITNFVGGGKKSKGSLVKTPRKIRSPRR